MHDQQQQNQACAVSTPGNAMHSNTIEMIQVRKKEKEWKPLPGFEPRHSGLPAQAHYLQTTWKVLIGENCIIQVSP